MAGEISTIQSLKAVDAWIDVINANINGGVRTAFKASRLKFAGSNANVDRAGTATSLPLQFPEPGLVTANTLVDFSQGALTASTENSHLAIQGEGFFLLVDPATIDPATGMTVSNPNARFLVTRDGEFHTDSQGLLVNANGFYLVRKATVNTASISYDTTLRFGGSCQIRAIYNDIDNPSTAAAPQRAQRLSDYLLQTGSFDIAGITNLTSPRSLMRFTGNLQNLEYSNFGSTIYDIHFKANADASLAPNVNPVLLMTTTATDLALTTPTIITKSLESSNASMTQSVPELSLAQKLFSALTKVLQTKQTNIDGVLNLVR